MVSKKLLFLITLCLFQTYLTEVCYVSNCFSCQSNNPNYCISCYSGYYISYGKCYWNGGSMDWTWIIIGIVAGTISIIGAICRCCCYGRPVQSRIVISSNNYQPPQPTSPIITTSTTTINNTVPPVPNYYNNVPPVPNYNQGYNQGNQGYGMTTSAPTQNANQYYNNNNNNNAGGYYQQ